VVLERRTHRKSATPTEKEYLRTIYFLSRRSHGSVRVSALAKEMGLRPSSVTEMIYKMSRVGLVEHSPYHGVELTQRGEALTKQVIRVHTLIEKWLVGTLHFGEGEARKEASRLVGHLSEPAISRICKSLGCPTTGLKGEPINQDAHCPFCTGMDEDPSHCTCR
jgi:DtxR family Mn-dependent transcriptional regulator